MIGMRCFLVQEICYFSKLFSGVVMWDAAPYVDLKKKKKKKKKMKMVASVFSLSLSEGGRVSEKQRMEREIGQSN